MKYLHINAAGDGVYSSMTSPEGDPSFIEIPEVLQTQPVSSLYYKDGIVKLKVAPPNQYYLFNITTEEWVYNIQLHRTDKLNTFSVKCASDIRGGFFSTAKGSPRVYLSQDIDQQNLTSAAIMAVRPEAYTYKFWSFVMPPHPSTPGSEWTDAEVTAFNIAMGSSFTYVSHNNAQILTLLTDFNNLSQDCRNQLETKNAAVNAATTEAQINAIVWTGLSALMSLNF